jgi:hypothetical protein
VSSSLLAVIPASPPGGDKSSDVVSHEHRLLSKDWPGSAHRGLRPDRRLPRPVLVGRDGSIDWPCFPCLTSSTSRRPAGGNEGPRAAAAPAGSAVDIPDGKQDSFVLSSRAMGNADGERGGHRLHAPRRLKVDVTSPGHRGPGHRANDI